MQSERNDSNTSNLHYHKRTDAMVSSTCSSASIESAPAGFPGFTADNAADVATDAAGNKLVVRERPVSISEAECVSRDALRNSPLTISTQSNNKSRYECKRSTPMKLSSISKRGRYDSAFRSAPDYYPRKMASDPVEKILRRRRRRRSQ